MLIHNPACWSSAFIHTNHIKATWIHSHFWKSLYFSEKNCFIFSFVFQDQLLEKLKTEPQQEQSPSTCSPTYLSEAVFSLGKGGYIHLLNSTSEVHALDYFPFFPEDFNKKMRNETALFSLSQLKPTKVGVTHTSAGRGQPPTTLHKQINAVKCTSMIRWIQFFSANF